MAWTHPVEGTPKDSRPRAGELAVTGGPQSVVVPFQKRKSFANFVFGFPADRQVGVACLTRTLRRRISSSEAAECGGHGFCSPQRRGLISLRERRSAALRAGASDRLCWRWTGTWGGHIPKYVSKRATIGAYFVVVVWVVVFVFVWGGAEIEEKEERDAVWGRVGERSGPGLSPPLIGWLFGRLTNWLKP